MIKLERFSERIYLTNQKALGMSVRGAVILTDTKALVFDTLVFPKDMAEIQSLCGTREITVVYSHADWDHVWGTCALNYKEVIAQENCAERFKDPKDVAETLKNYQTKHSQELADVKLIAPTRTFKKTLKLELDEMTFELTHLAGHTADCLVMLVPSEGVLFGGDTLENPMPIIYEDSPLGSWIEKLEGWAADERVQTVIPCHGEFLGRTVLENNIAYLNAIRNGEVADVANLDAFYTSTHEQNKKLAPTLR